MATMESASSGAPVWDLVLHPASHPGLTESLADALCASARICLHRHHAPPAKIRARIDEHPKDEQLIAWSAPSQRERNANANPLDATRDGAYAVALMYLERKLSLVALGRARDRSGADWYVAPTGRGVTEGGEPNLDDPDVIRLEVGGHDDRPSLAYELKAKVRQLAAGASDMPGIAVVVGFMKAELLIRTNVRPAQMGVLYALPRV